MQPASARRRRDRAAHPAHPAPGARSAGTIAERPPNLATGERIGASDAKVIAPYDREIVVSVFVKLACVSMTVGTAAYGTSIVGDSVGMR